MKKAISLLTSMMVMSLVAANMAIPASAAGEVTLDIDDITLTVDELQANEKVTVDGADYYAVDLDVLYTDTTGDGIGSFTLAFDTDNSTLGLEPSNSSGTKYAFTGHGDNDEYVFDDLDSSLKSKRGTLLIFNAEVEDEASPLWPSKLADGTTRKALAVSVLVPASATDGTYTLAWDQSATDDFFAADGSTAIIPTLKDGSITIGAGDTTTSDTTPVETTGEISLGNVEVEVDGDALAADTTVQVPVSIKGNPGFATADIYHDLTIAAAASGAVATYDVEGTKMVLVAGDLTTDKDLEGAATGKFPGKVMVVQNDAEDITGDGVIYYVSITVPAGAKVGDKFDITFDKDGGDFELYSNADMSKAMIPALVDGSITLVGGTPDPEPVVTEGTISLEDKVVELDASDVDADGNLLADMSVQVAVSIKDNPGFATADIYHDLTVTSKNGVTATYDVDGTKLVLTAGDLTTDKDLEGAATGKFPGKVMVVQNDAEDITGDGVIYYVNITVPAGTNVDDVFDVNFDEDGGDFELYGNADMSKAIIPALVNGSISFSLAEETTTPEEETTTPEEETTTPEEETTTPEEETTTPEEETTTPEEETTTQAPETTTQAPETTTQAPETTTQAPETTTQAPETTTQAPTQIVTGEQGGNGDINVSVSGGEGGDVSADVSAGGGDADVSVDVSAGGGNADVSVGGGDNSNSNENGNTIENNPTINITVNGGGSADGTQAPAGTQAPTPTTAATTAATTKATTAATTAATTKATTTAKSSDSPSTGSTGIGATIMAMIAAAASAFALKKKND